MRHLLSAFMLIIAPAVGSAQDLPAAFSVTGVAANDVLNIRSEPSAQSSIIGEIGPFGINIEVLETNEDGTWGKIGLPEGNGWVSMAFLDAAPPADATLVPRPLSCFGTEPFWSVNLFVGGAEFTAPDTGPVALTVTAEAVAPQGYLVTLDEGPTLNRTLVITKERCSDGMSDRMFGFATRMFMQAPDGNAAFQGCCTLDHR